MDQRPPRVFISYSHESPAHEQQVLGLSDRLRKDGVDADLDQYGSPPEEGWPFWMENQIREADFVLVVCSEAYLRRVEHKEESLKGGGVVWEINSIYNRLYSERLLSKKFIPVLFAGATPDHIPVPLKGFNYYRVDSENGYDLLYRHLTDQPRASRPDLGTLRSLPAKERSRYSLPTVFSLERLSKTVSNPRYADDIFRLDRFYDERATVNRETVVIVVGTTIVAELLDRPAAELLRDRIDQCGGEFPFRRGIVMTDQGWYAEAAIIAKNPVISIGGPVINKLSDEFDRWKPAPPSGEGKYTIPGADARTRFFRRNQARLPQVGLWGHTASATRETVEHYIKNEKGLTEFLSMCWR